MKNLNLKKGDKVRTVLNEWYTVYEVRDNVVYVLEFIETIHITKIIQVVSC